MCLAIPGKILEIQEQGKMRAARVQFGGIVRQVSLDFVPEAGLGDYVMVHVGFAISRVDASEAERTYKLLEEMGVLEAELPPRGSVIFARPHSEASPALPVKADSSPARPPRARIGFQLRTWFRSHRFWSHRF